MAAHDPKAIARPYFEEVWNQRKLDVVDDIFAPTWASPGFPGPRTVSCSKACTSDSTPGVRRIAVGMARQGYDLQLTRYDEKGWRATFYTTEMEHSPTSATGTGWEPTPWHSTQRAAWETPDRASRP